MKSSEFIRIVGAYSSEYIKEGLLPSVMIAQACLESGYGGSGLSVNANNLFGIKAGREWYGDVYTCNTKEFVNGKYIETVAKFRKYFNMYESMIDHIAFLKSYERYKPLFGERNIDTFLYKLGKSGYATAPDYAQKLKNVIVSNKLEHFDNILTRYTVTVSPGDLYKFVELAKSLDIKGEYYNDIE